MKYLKTYEELDPGLGADFRAFKATKELVLLIIKDLEEEWKKKEKNKNWDYHYTDCTKVSIDKVQKLIDMGADVNAHDDENNYGSLLNMAVDRKDLDLIKCLLDNSADINDSNSCGSTPLYNAVWKGYSDIVKYLVNRGANVNIPNDAGIFPVALSIFRKNYDDAIFLFEHGANIKINDTLYFKNMSYNFQKELCEKFPNEAIKIPEEYFSKRILKKYEYIFNTNKYNL